MSAYEIAELISLGLTVPTVVLALAVVAAWGPASIRAFKRGAANRRGEDWFILGVVSGFIGATMDNIYWAFPWTATFLEHRLGHELTMLGVFFNIVSRQGLGIVAAFCHMKAYEKSSPTRGRLLLAILLGGSWLVGASFSCLLMVIK